MIRNDEPADELASNSNWLTVAIIILAILSCFVLLALLVLNPRSSNSRSPPYAYAGYDFGRGLYDHVHHHQHNFHYHENLEQEKGEFEVQTRSPNSGQLKTLEGGEIATITLPLEDNFSSSDNSTFSNNSTFIDGVCSTAGCIEAGRWLAESLDYNIGPCDDFYSFVCDGKEAKPEGSLLYPDQDTVSPFTALEDQVSLAVKSLLEGQLKEEVEPRSVLIAQQLYQECVHQDAVKNVQALKEKIAQLLNTDTWPLVLVEEPFSYSKMTFLLTYLRFCELQVSPIIDFGVEVDANFTQRSLVHFRAPKFGLKRFQFADAQKHHKAISAYRRYLHDLFKRFTMDEVDFPVDEILDIQIEERVNELLAFESQLALLTLPLEDEEGDPTNLPSSVYNPMTLEDFKNLTGNTFDWTMLLRMHIGSVDVNNLPTDADTIVVKDIPYYQAITPLLEKTPLYLLYNYLGVRFLDSLSTTFVDGHLKAIHTQYLQRTTEIERLRPFWRRCVDETSRLLPVPVSRLYVQSQVPKVQRRKEAALRLISEIRIALIEYLQDPEGSGSYWFDDQSREEALKKASTTLYSIGYPNWLLINNNTAIDHRVGLNKDVITMEEGNYLDSVLSVRRFQIAREIRDLGEIRSNNDLKMSPVEVNSGTAFLLFNTVSLPVTISQKPFFATDRPPTLNFGALGSLVANQMAHLFDRQGAEHKSSYSEDENNNKELNDNQEQHPPNTSLQNWWTEETMNRWDDAADCFREQYASIEDPETKININENRTLDENIADNGAIRLSWFAWWHQKNTRNRQDSQKPLQLPQMEAFTDEQLFFISYAKNFCSTSRLSILTDNANGASNSAPNKFRVNVALSNFEQFSSAFHCTTGTSMNPPDKCRLW